MNVKLKDLSRVWRDDFNPSCLQIVNDEYREIINIFMYVSRDARFWRDDKEIIAYDIVDYALANRRELGTNYDYKDFNELGEKLGLKDLENYYVLYISGHNIAISKNNLLRD